MFDSNKHRTTMVNILKVLYANEVLSSVLGFKGGTAALLFYGLPRMSVDLDFDLLDSQKEDDVYLELKKILPKFGKIIEGVKKKNTIFFLIDYGFGERNLKIEISKRILPVKYEQRNYLGIPMVVMVKESMLSCKLMALLNRKKFATRDVFDIWYFLSQGWQFDTIVKKVDIKKSIKKVEKIKENEILYGLGDLLDEKQKAWVKINLKKELIFHLKLIIKN